MSTLDSDNGHVVMSVVGTRPEIIKMAPVIHELHDRSEFSNYILHTGQHYDEELSETFFETLSLPKPDENLSVGSGSQAVQTAAGLRGIETAIENVEPEGVLAQGDTNAVLSAAIATSKCAPLFGHVEAGIRSGDRSMPEEVNRVVADAVADLAFAPAETAAANLTQESTVGTIHVTGNTIVDACRRHAEISARVSDIRPALGVGEQPFVVATIHRPLNTNTPERFVSILNALETCSYPVIFPAHPRTQNAMDDIGYTPGGSLRVVDPLDYLDFLNLLRNAKYVVTDSGGIQEEASIFEVPCLTVRPNTERPETVDAGVNELVTPNKLAKRMAAFARDETELETMRGAPNLYGDGDAAEHIVDHLAQAFESHS